jgi:hypothetical protein
LINHSKEYIRWLHELHTRRRNQLVKESIRSAFGIVAQHPPAGLAGRTREGEDQPARTVIQVVLFRIYGVSRSINGNRLVRAFEKAMCIQQIQPVQRFGHIIESNFRRKGMQCEDLQERVDLSVRFDKAEFDDPTRFS